MDHARKVKLLILETISMSIYYYYYYYLIELQMDFYPLTVVLLLKTPWPESASELYRPSNSRLSTTLVLTFADRRGHVVSVTDLCGRILDFLDRVNGSTIRQHKNTKTGLDCGPYILIFLIRCDNCIVP
jgi:hypothetical protein